MTSLWRFYFNVFGSAVASQVKLYKKETASLESETTFYSITGNQLRRAEGKANTERQALSTLLCVCLAWKKDKSGTVRPLAAFGAANDVSDKSIRKRDSHDP